MHLPFSTEAFLDVFVRYNTAIWPLHVVVYALGILAVLAAVRPYRGSQQVITGILALLWLWVGAVYHLVFFRQINPAAMAFGMLFIAQGMLFLLTGFRSQQHYPAQTNLYSVTGGVFILYAMVIYPALGYIFGHIYPRAPMFGVAPCPLLVFTFGLLLFTSQRVPWYLLVIPFLWSIVGLSAALTLGIHQDLALIISAVVTVSLLALRNSRDISRKTA
ncbi:MAG: DUF6064 family protein [Armatimonadota bacterium]